MKISTNTSVNMYRQVELKGFSYSISPWCQPLTLSHGLWLFLLFSGIILHMAISIASSPNERIIYITPTQPPNPECPQNISCQTLEYYIENLYSIVMHRNGDSQFELTMMFLSGNHTTDIYSIHRIFGSRSMTIHMIRLEGIMEM